MSQGPGRIETQIADLFAATRDRALSVAEIANHAFDMGGGTQTRSQRLSATRAAHRLIRRMKWANEMADKLYAMARLEADAAVGPRPEQPPTPRSTAGWEAFGAALEAYKAATAPWDAAFKASKSHQRAESLKAYVKQFGDWVRIVRAGRGRLRLEPHYWRATLDESGTLYFHPPDVPIQVWAVSVQRAGTIWVEAEIVRIAERFVTVRYAGELARLHREKLWHAWAWWRGVMFVSHRDGAAAQYLDDLWQRRYGHAAGGVPPAMQMPLAEAIALLKVPANYTKDDVLAAFRREAKKAHPDLGGTAEMFTALVKARDRLLAALGTNAPAPKPPTYAPKGVPIVYRPIRSSGPARLGSTKLLG
jgi:hypothetical protein